MTYVYVPYILKKSKKAVNNENKMSKDDFPNLNTAEKSYFSYKNSGNNRFCRKDFGIYEFEASHLIEIGHSGLILKKANAIFCFSFFFDIHVTGVESFTIFFSIF